jgi:hypothetical protein
VELKLCPECGVPELITTEHIWLDNGDIVHARAKSSRILFLETENLDPLFQGIERIIGLPIEQMVITAARRAYGVYLGAFFPEELKKRIRDKESDYGHYDAMLFELAEANGTGKYSQVSHRYERDENDYDTVTITNPVSVPMTVAAHIGAIEMFTGIDYGYTYEKESPDVYKISLFPSPHLEEFKKRLLFEPYVHRDGDYELERCPTCGGPRGLAAYRWHRDRGIIVNRNNKRRMGIQGNALLDPVFQELEEELGDAIPRAVVEAQRRFTRGGFYTMDDITGEGDFRFQLALRGLGNLKEIEMRRKGMRMRVENVSLPLIIVGLAQGFFEMGFAVDSSDVDWDLTSDGALEMEVRPRST